MEISHFLIIFLYLNHLIWFNHCHYDITSNEEDDLSDRSRFFHKNDGLDMKFPPPIVKPPFDDMPVGHLQPLGSQRQAEGEVKTVLAKDISADQFLREFVIKNQALVIRQIIDKSDPIRLSKWSDKELLLQHKSNKIKVIHYKETENLEPELMTLNKFIHFYKYQDIYVDSLLPYSLNEDLKLSSALNCHAILDNLIATKMSMAYGGTGSLLHYHGDHQVHCQIDGRRDFILIDAKYRENLYFKEYNMDSGEGYSTLNVEVMDLFKVPIINSIPWHFASLHPGDCLFIPAGTLHQVRSLGRSLSYTLLISPQIKNHQKLNDSCKNDESTKLAPTKLFSQLDFMLTERNGFEQSFNENLKAEDVRRILIKLIQNNDSELTLSRFQYFYELISQKATVDNAMSNQLPSVESIFSNLAEGASKHSKLTLDQINRISTRKLEIVARILNKIHIISDKTKNKHNKRHDEL